MMATRFSFYDDFRVFVRYFNRIKSSHPRGDSLDVRVDFFKDGDQVKFVVSRLSDDRTSDDSARTTDFLKRLNDFVDSLNRSGRYKRSKIEQVCYVYDTDFGVQLDTFGW